MCSSCPHPLAPLSTAEFLRARDVVTASHPPGTCFFFRSIFLHEPPKAALVPFLEAEHAGDVQNSSFPQRRAEVEYDVVTSDRHQFTKAVVDLAGSKVVKTVVGEPLSQPYFTVGEFALFQDACVKSQLFKDAMSEFALPEGFAVTIDPWPHGSLGDGEVARRYMQGLVFARDSSNNNADSNHYAYPIPIIPIMDWVTKTVIRIDRLATGGAGDPPTATPRGGSPRKLFEKSTPAEYVPELLQTPIRNDVTPLDIVQPEGASFRVHSDNLVEWQKWRFRLSFTPREGAVLHDITYDNRSVLYRLSYSELTVPYADPRPPFHRKQAFDLGDGGFGRAANNLQLGCDCVGAIHYFDSHLAASDGSPTPAEAVVCLHEQDNGILWKHTNYRTNRAVVTRLRELVVQFIATLANYEYVLAFKLDVAGGITVETRATGVMSVVAIDHDKTSPYGNVVAPGVLAQNHQHVFAIRIDPAIDSYQPGETNVVVEESVPQPMNGDTNPFGNYYEIQRRPVSKATWIDAEPRLNRVIRLENPTRKNEMSGKSVGYKLIPSPTQLLLADEKSTIAKRAPYAQHHVWVTGYRDGELWAAGEFTNQSTHETGGVAHMVKRGDWFLAEDGGKATDGCDREEAALSAPVVWSVFCLTHNPRVEDWPVMPVEIHQTHIRPADFFDVNPALDMPSKKNVASVAVGCCSNSNGKTVQQNGAETARKPAGESPLSHMQGAGPDVGIEESGASVDRFEGSARRVSTWKGYLGGVFKRNKGAGKNV